MNKHIEKKLPVKIKGNGTSLWGESKGEFSVSKAKIFTFDFNHGEEPVELQLFGKNTEWYHYTDEQIERNVNKHFLSAIRKDFPQNKILMITWSEQGMQPDGGWSFDIICKQPE